MVVVYDIETLKSCFTYTAFDIHTKKTYKFVIHRELNQYKELIEHLKQCKGGIGFNNINFDYPILHMLMTRISKAESENAYLLIEKIYEKAQEIVSSQNSENFYKTIAIKTKDWLIHQLDLFKVWHYNNKARKQYCGLIW